MPVPVVSDVPSGSFPQDVGLWDNVGALAPAASATIGSGTVSGGRWFMWLQVGLAGDCYEFEGTSSLGSAQMGACGPIGAPGVRGAAMEPDFQKMADQIAHLIYWLTKSYSKTIERQLAQFAPFPGLGDIAG